MPGETNADSSTDPAAVWKAWNETTAMRWPKTPDRRKNIYSDPFGLYRFWMQPAMSFPQWNVAGRLWAQMVEEMMNPEQLLEAHYQLVNTYMHIFIETSHLVNAMLFPNQQISTRLDAAHVAALVASLEERVYAIEDALVPVEDDDLKMVSGQVLEGLEEHLEYVKGAQDPLNLPSSILPSTEVIQDLAGRLERVEGKLDLLLAALEKIGARVYPEAI